MHGGILNGVQVDPVTYLLGGLHAKFSALEEESRLTAMTEMLAFACKPGEHINQLLARYDTVRHRAAVEGQFVMSIEGCALQLCRAIGVGPPTPLHALAAVRRNVAIDPAAIRPNVHSVAKIRSYLREHYWKYRKHAERTDATSPTRSIHGG